MRRIEYKRANCQNRKASNHFIILTLTKENLFVIVLLVIVCDTTLLLVWLSTFRKVETKSKEIVFLITKITFISIFL